MSIVQPICRPITHPLTHALTAAGGWAWVPSRLFRNGEKGLALDLTDMSKLYQDSARTTLVTATGQPIGSASDISGNGVHASQADALKRPTYDGYATFNGTSSAWQTSAIDFSASDAITIVVGVYKAVDDAVRFIAELSADVNVNNGSFYLAAPGSAAPNYDFRSKGTTSSGGTIATTYTAPISNVVYCESDISTPVARIYVDGTLKTTNSNTQGTGNFGNHALNIGARNGVGFFFSGRIYRMVVIGRLLTADERAQVTAWCGDPFS